MAGEKESKPKKEKKEKKPKDEKFLERFQGVFTLNGKEIVTPEVFKKEDKAMAAASKLAIAQGLVKTRKVKIRRKSVEEIVTA